MSTCPRLSFEFFPPRDEAQSRRFWRTVGALEPLAPSYVSLTWGALGSDSRASLDALALLDRDTSFEVAAHLSCIGQTADELRATLDTLEGLGISRIVALRGDAPDARAAAPDAFRHASELVSLIATERPHLDISVAAYPETHPEAPSSDDDLHWLARKLERGASRAITQFFFEPETFLRWRDRAVRAGIDKPLVPGILPVHDIGRVQRFASRCGASVPPALIARFERAASEAERRSLAVEQCIELCRALGREGVEELHLYTLNQSSPTHAIASELLGTTASAVAA